MEEKNQIVLLNEICEMIETANYDVQDIYDFCQNKISELQTEGSE